MLFRPAGLSEKESALFMERLAALERSGATEGPIKGAWEDAFLDLTHRLITQPGTEVQGMVSLLLSRLCSRTPYQNSCDYMGFQL
jgi:hypothetical protein